MSKIYFDVYVIEVTEDTIPQIIEKTDPLGWTLGYNLKDNMEYNAEDGFRTLLFMKLYRGTTEIATFGEESWEECNPDLRILEETDPLFGLFHKFETAAR